MKAAVVGGGLAGLAAALDLVDAGQEVTVLEARPTLGGAVQTLPERDGDPEPPPDNGQHIALGCFDAYLAFIERIGEAHNLSASALRCRSSTSADAGRRSHRASACCATATCRCASASPRRGRPSGCARSTPPRRPTAPSPTYSASPTRRSIASGTSSSVRHSTCRARRPSADLGVFTVQTALLGKREASDLLLPTAPLGAMHGEAAARALEEAGAVVRTSARVAALESGALVLADGDRVEADAFVVALPPHESARLLGEPEPQLEDSPIVRVHLLFDRELLGPPLAALLSSPAHWVFDRGALTGHRPELGQYLTVVSSGAPELIEARGRELVELIARELTDRLGEAELLWSRVSREPDATFAGRPGTRRLRAGTRTAARARRPRGGLDGHGLARHDGRSRPERQRCGAHAGG